MKQKTAKNAGRAQVRKNHPHPRKATAAQKRARQASARATDPLTTDTTDRLGFVPGDLWRTRMAQVLCAAGRLVSENLLPPDAAYGWRLEVWWRLDGALNSTIGVGDSPEEAIANCDAQYWGVRPAPEDFAQAWPLHLQRTQVFRQRYQAAIALASIKPSDRRY